MLADYPIDLVLAFHDNPPTKPYAASGTKNMVDQANKPPKSVGKPAVRFVCVIQKGVVTEFTENAGGVVIIH
jgi:hypothetical protein